MDNTEWVQKEFTLKARPRGFHLITREAIDHLPEIREIEAGLLHLFIQHTSASLTINENADPDVRGDMERHFNQAVRERALLRTHSGRPGRHARSHQIVNSRLLAFDTGGTRPVTPRRLAGNLPLRTSQRRRPATSGGDFVRKERQRDKGTRGGGDKGIERHEKGAPKSPCPLVSPSPCLSSYFSTPTVKCELIRAEWKNRCVAF